MSSAWFKLKQVAHVLVGPEPPRERLAHCYTSYLANLKPRDLPVEVRADFASLALKLGHGGGINIKHAREALEAVSDTEVMSMIHAIIDMYDAVTRYQPLLTAKDYEAKKYGLSDEIGDRRWHRCGNS